MSEPPIAIAEEWITIARIARPQGVRGEVIADLLTDFPSRFARLKTVRVVTADGVMHTLTLEKSWLHKGRIVLKFADYGTVERAEELRNARVTIPQTQLVKLPADNWYEFELVDCEVSKISGERVGVVKGVENYGAAPLLKVQTAEREVLIPLALDICKVIDPANRRIVIDPPEGLLEL